MNAMCKKLLSLAMVLAMVLTMTPVISVPAAATTTNYASPVGDIVAAQSGAVKCDACKQDISWDDWTPITMETLGCAQMFDTATTFALQPGTHYYLAEDIIAYTATQVPFLTVTAGNPICLHLNGKTIRNVKNQTDLDAPGANVAENIVVGSTGTGTVIDANAGTLNLMGEGYAACRENNSPNAVVTINGGAVNVYGGTYNNHRNARACITIGKSGGSLAVYGGIFQDPLGIRGGSSNTAGTIAVHGGELTARCLFESSNTSPLAAGSQLTVTGGTFQLATSIMEDGMDLTIQPVITGGTFSKDPSNFVTGCYAATETDSVWTVAESHAYGEDDVCADCGKKKSELPAFEPEKNDGYAYCEACYKQALAVEGTTKEQALTAAWKQWNVYNGEWFGSGSGEYYTGDHIHYYLDSDKTFDHTKIFLYTKGKTCLNLNGYTISPIDPETGKAPTAGASKGGATITTTSRLYIMDSSEEKTGTVIGNIGKINTDGAAIRLNWASARCYLYGGTFTRLQPAEAAVCRPILAACSGGGRFYMYDGAIIDGTGLTNTTGTTCVYLDGKAATEEDAAKLAQFNMYGGEIIGGEATDSSAIGGAIIVGASSTSYAEFNLYDGEIHGGVAPNGGNIYVNNGTLNMEDGEIYGGQTTGNGGNIYVSGNGELNMSGGEIYGTNYDANATTPKYDAQYGGNIQVLGGGVVNLSGTAVVRDGAASAQGGNVRVTNNSQLNMSGSAKIYNGIAPRGGNIRTYAADSATLIPRIVMDGNAQVYGGFATNSTNHEDNVWIGHGELVMKGNATIRGTYNEETGATVKKSALAMTKYSVLALEGNATIANSGVPSYNIASVSTDSTIIVAKDWKGQVNLTNDSVSDGVVSGYVGTYDLETKTGTKDTTANVSFSENLFCYDNGNMPVMAKNGDLRIASCGVVTASGETLYITMEEAQAALNGNAVLKPYVGTTVELSGDSYVDVNGKAVEFTGTGKLYLMNSFSDDYMSSSQVTVPDSIEIVRDVTNAGTGNRYINVTLGKEAGTQTVVSYRVDMALDTVTLRAGKTSEGMGLYYKVKLSMGSALANHTTTYGVVLSLVDMPGANFVTEGNQNGFTAMDEIVPVSAENGYTVTVNSGALFGIMKADASMKEANAIRGTMPVYANAYLEIDADGDGVGEFYMAENTGEDIAWSLFDILDTIDGRWSDFKAAQQKVTEFYSFWSDYGMDAWTFDNIKKA